MTSDTTAPLTDALAAATLVLDGGLSNQLGAAGHDLSDELWSARLLADEPGAITEAHLAYYEAGADVAITSSYQATIEGFAKRGVERDRASELIGLSVELALDAAVETWRRGVKRPLYVAGSVGPYGAMLADGSEYRGAGRRRTGCAGPGDDPGHRRGRGAVAGGARTADARLAVVLDRR
jgi:homocysteine S-methyltransferase